jgi:proteasome assembly chaperone (PAC2) family protein
MSLIQYYKQPALRDPVVIVAFGGWNDAADAATTAVKFLIQRWKPVKIAEIDSEDFFVFTETRPTVHAVDGMHRTITWPSNQFFSYSDLDMSRDVILFLGVEPQLKWKTFCNAFLEVCKRFNASEVVFLGALLADVPHSMAVPISATSTDNIVLERLREMDVRKSHYEGPTGMIGVLHDACYRSKLPSASLWAAAPHYLAATPNIKVTAALLTYLNTYLSLDLDLSDIQSDAVHFEEQITALVAKDPEASAYVHKLEEQAVDEDEDEEEDDNDDITIDVELESTPEPLPSADSLIRDVEELLRQQRKNGRRQHYDNNNTEESE